MSKLLKPTTDPAYDIWRSQHQPLRPILAPEAVALIGATERPGSVGRTLLWNLISSPFGGSIFPVNPKRRNVLGIRAYPNVYSLPEAVDLAVIATPASSVPDLIGDCVEVGIKGAIVISAGFREIGAAGLELGGSVLLFGTGGELVEVFRDRAIALPPLNTTLARRLMEQTKIYQALKGVRGRRAVNLSLLEKLLVKFSYLGEFALLVSDPWQKQGLGIELLRRLVQIGREENLERIKAEILPENRAMQRVCEKVCFRLQRTPDLFLAQINLEEGG